VLEVVIFSIYLSFRHTWYMVTVYHNTSLCLQFDDLYNGLLQLIWWQCQSMTLQIHKLFSFLKKYRFQAIVILINDS